jgi:hypothetical protein
MTKRVMFTKSCNIVQPANASIATTASEQRYLKELAYFFDDKRDADFFMSDRPEPGSPRYRGWLRRSRRMFPIVIALKKIGIEKSRLLSCLSLPMTDMPRPLWPLLRRTRMAFAESSLLPSDAQKSRFLDCLALAMGRTPDGVAPSPAAVAKARRDAAAALAHIEAELREALVAYAKERQLIERRRRRLSLALRDCFTALRGEA